MSQKVLRGNKGRFLFFIYFFEKGKNIISKDTLLFKFLINTFDIKRIENIKDNTTLKEDFFLKSEYFFNCLINFFKSTNLIELGNEIVKEGKILSTENFLTLLKEKLKLNGYYYKIGFFDKEKTKEYIYGNDIYSVRKDGSSLFIGYL